MLNFKITTDVNRPHKAIIKGFGLDLFSKLKPLGASIKVVQFDGCKKGDIVKVELKLLGFIKQTWTSYVTESEETNTEFRFVDEPKQKSDLPFFLGKWKHVHRIVSTGEQTSQIVDDVSFEGRFAVLSYFLYPILYLQFAMRKTVYRNMRIEV